VGSEYVGLAFVVEPDGDEVEVRASLRGDGEDWGGSLIGRGTHQRRLHPGRPDVKRPPAINPGAEILF
jgi:hypothetical protein